MPSKPLMAFKEIAAVAVGLSQEIERYMPFAKIGTRFKLRKISVALQRQANAIELLPRPQVASGGVPVWRVPWWRRLLINLCFRWITRGIKG